MNRKLLKEYIREIVKQFLFEYETTSSISTSSTGGSTTASSSTSNPSSTTSTGSTEQTGSGSRSGDEFDEIEERIASNEDTIKNMKKDSTNLSMRTRDIQAANQNVQSNIQQAATSTERLRDARSTDEQNAAYTDTANALRNVATSVGDMAQKQGNMADILNKQGS